MVDCVGLGVICQLFVELYAEAEQYSILMGIERKRTGPAAADVTDALQATVPSSRGLPTLETGNVKLPISVAEASAHGSGGKAKRKFGDGSLWSPGHFVLHDQKHLAFAVRQVQQLSLG